MQFREGHRLRDGRTGKIPEIYLLTHQWMFNLRVYRKHLGIRIERMLRKI